MVPKDRKYTRTHLWCKIENSVVTIGLTAHGLQEMGTVWFIELPDPEDDVLHDVAIMEIETDKGQFDIFSPFDGMVTDTHSTLEDNPEKLASDPHDNGWLIKMRIDDPSQAENLLTPQQYDEFISG